MGMNDTINQIKNVPNNVEGQTFIKSLRKFLRNTPNGVSVRGRGPRKPFVSHTRSHERLRQDLPLKNATQLDPPPWGNGYVKTPTKWATPQMRANFQSGTLV